MLHRLFLATDRHRRAVVSCAVVLAVGVLAAESRHANIAWTVAPWAAGLTMSSFVLALTALNHRPATLIERPDVPAFDTPASLVGTFQCVGFVALATLNLRAGVNDFGEDTDGWWLAPAALYVAVLALLVRATWTGTGVRLTPDGVLDRTVVGTLFVPWEAFADERPAWPTRKWNRVILYYRSPELVRRRGIPLFGSRRATADNVDAWFLSRAIHHYVTQPAHRTAIGTGPEYRRLLAALDGTPR